MNKCILLCNVKSYCTRIQLCLICIIYVHFLPFIFSPLVFVAIYHKQNFLQIVLLVHVTQHRNAFLMWCVMCFFIFFCRAQTVHDNHQCSYWENVVHIHTILQYSIILEMIICSSSVTLFVIWFHDSFVWSVYITVDEKNFCQICSPSSISKNYTHNKNVHFRCPFMWYVCQICRFCTSANNTEMHFWCCLSCYHLYFLVQLKPCTIIISVISDKIWFTYMLYSNIT